MLAKLIFVLIYAVLPGGPAVRNFKRHAFMMYTCNFLAGTWG